MATRRLTIWLILGASVFMLLLGVVAVFVFSVPYLQYKASVNRKTGEYIEREVYFGIYWKRYYADVQPGVFRDLSTIGALTAQNTEIPIATTIYQHRFWSPKKMDPHYQRNELGDKVLSAYSNLFGQINAEFAFFSKRITPEKAKEYNDLYKRRILIWNSNYPETYTLEEALKLEHENNALFPR